MFENFIVEFAKPHRRLFLWLILLIYFFFLIGFALTLLFVNSQNISFDLAVTQKIQSLHNAQFADLMSFVSLFGSGFYLLIPFSVVLVWLWRSGFRHEALILPSVFVAPVVAELAKALVGRPRPQEGLVSVSGNFPGSSFPSGHVLFYTLFFGFVAFLAISLPKINPIARSIIFILCVLMIGLVGVSRIYLGAHWPTDVIAGYLVGFALLEILVVLYLKEVYLPKVRNKQNQAN
jgi:undecaprenyl-diphosphatase